MGTVFAVLFNGKIPVEFGTAFAAAQVWLSSDLQLLARPGTPLVDTLVGFFFRVTGKVFPRNTNRHADDT